MATDLPQEDRLPPNRRDFLTGKALLDRVAVIGEEIADQLAEGEEPPVRFASGPTVRLGKSAMACEFDVILNPGPGGRLKVASEMLELIDRLEDQMTVYRKESELSRLNREAPFSAVEVEERLFDLLDRARRLSEETSGAFDPTSGPLVKLWRACQKELRLPREDEIQERLSQSGMKHVDFQRSERRLRFDRPGVELNLGAIGKGYALDRGAEVLVAGGLNEWLIHGGQSSILGRGGHLDHPGWPVGIRNPQLPDRLMATLLLKNRGMGTSGSGTQFFRLEGTRYGHILDPRSGWPAQGMLSVSVMAPSAAEADALATAFFVMGVEKSIEFCHNHPSIQAILVPLPEAGRRLQPFVVGVPECDLEFVRDVSPVFDS